MVNLSGISRASTIGRLLRLPLALVPRSAVVRILQGRLRGWRWIAGSSNHGCWLGSYEMPKQRAFVRAIHPGQTIYDVGANVGFYTLLAAQCVSDQGRVFAFEPAPENISFLQRHVQLNHCRNVEIHPLAISDHSGKMKFQQTGSRSTGHLAAEGGLEVNVISLDEFIYHHAHPAPDVIKVDVEGAEFEVLCGARRLLASDPPVIFLATHNPEAHTACCQLLNSLDYELEGIDGKDAEMTDELICRPVR